MRFMSYVPFLSVGGTSTGRERFQEVYVLCPLSQCGWDIYWKREVPGGLCILSPFSVLVGHLLEEREVRGGLCLLSPFSVWVGHLLEERGSRGFMYSVPFLSVGGHLLEERGSRRFMYSVPFLSVGGHLLEERGSRRFMYSVPFLSVGGHLLEEREVRGGLCLMSPFSVWVGHLLEEREIPGGLCLLSSFSVWVGHLLEEREVRGGLCLMSPFSVWVGHLLEERGSRGFMYYVPFLSVGGTSTGRERFQGVYVFCPLSQCGWDIYWKREVPGGLCIMSPFSVLVGHLLEEREVPGGLCILSPFSVLVDIYWKREVPGGLCLMSPFSVLVGHLLEERGSRRFMYYVPFLSVGGTSTGRERFQEVYVLCPLSQCGWDIYWKREVPGGLCILSPFSVWVGHLLEERGSGRFMYSVPFLSVGGTSTGRERFQEVYVLCPLSQCGWDIYWKREVPGGLCILSPFSVWVGHLLEERGSRRFMSYVPFLSVGGHLLEERGSRRFMYSVPFLSVGGTSTGRERFQGVYVFCPLSQCGWDIYWKREVPGGLCLLSPFSVWVGHLLEERGSRGFMYSVPFLSVGGTSTGRERFQEVYVFCPLSQCGWDIYWKREVPGGLCLMSPFSVWVTVVHAIYCLVFAIGRSCFGHSTGSCLC